MEKHTRVYNLDLIWNEEENRFHIVQYPGTYVLRIETDIPPPPGSDSFWFLQRPDKCDAFTWDSSWYCDPIECVETLRSILLKKVRKIERERKGS